MSGGTALQKDRNFIAVIGDEDSVTGLLLAGIGHVNQQQKRNFLVVDAKTPLSTIEETFLEYTKRKDIAIILINQHVAEDIRELVDGHSAAFPAVLEIPSKDHPYDPEKDSVLKRCQKIVWRVKRETGRLVLENGTHAEKRKENNRCLFF